jgi:LAO/AO transport system kinase
MRWNVEDLVEGLLKGERRALAKSITLLESTRDIDRIDSERLLSLLGEEKMGSIRIGISGVPGAGKSTFIETFGLYAISQGKKVAVLAVDPTSPVSGGSILGDKTRMPMLAMSDNAFIRPSPSQGNLGGVARQTKETIRLCEVSGYDIIFVETVGVGQSETAVSNLTDFFLLLLISGAGDELQGIKKGIMEMADLILINKADGDNKVAANRAKSECLNALSLARPRKNFWKTDVLTISALHNEGIGSVWKEILRYVDIAGNSFLENRKEQNKTWLWEYIETRVQEEILHLRNTNNVINDLETNLEKGSISHREAARKIIDIYKNN